MCGFVVCPHTVASVATSVSPAIVMYYVRKVILFINNL